MHAQESRDDKFRAWDTNRDGRLEMGEMQQNQANFRAMDCNNDGYLTRTSSRTATGATRTRPTSRRPGVADEFRASTATATACLVAGRVDADADDFRRYDRNNDGRVTRDEYAQPARPQHAPKAASRPRTCNNDGMITRAEWRGDRVDLRPPRPQQRRSCAGRVQQPAATGAPTPLRRLDRNNDACRAASGVDRAPSTATTATTTAW